jgi:glyoxylase-like metal-dependent hydrolase (beta-lactamase superfamily II)
MLITPIELSPFKASGYAMFGSTPDTEWQRNYPPNEANLCDWALRSLIIRQDNYVVLIDTGFSWLDRRILDQYKVNKHTPSHILLEKSGIDPKSITHAIHTHLHVDHCGGSFTEDEFGNLVPAFPNAQYVVSRKQFETAKNPSSFESESFQPEIIEAFGKYNNLNLIENESFLFPWLELQLFNGHTNGMIVPLIHKDKEVLAFTGDLIPSVAHLNLSSTMDYDVNKLLCLAEREMFLEEAFENEYKLFFQHDAHYQGCSLKKVGEKYIADQMLEIENL